MADSLLEPPAPAPPPPPINYPSTVPGSWLGPLKFKVDGVLIHLQPKRHPSEKKVPTLLLDMRRGTIQLTQHAPWLPDDCMTVHGVIGVVKLAEGMLVALITKCKRVSCMEDALYHVTETQLITHEATKTNNSDIRYAAMFQEALDVKEGGGGHMYFSHRTHVTLSAQQQARLQVYNPTTGSTGSQKGGKGQGTKAPSMWAQADKRFVWNAALAQPLIEAGAEAFVMPVMVGYIGQVPEVRLPSVVPGHTAAELSVTLISRIDCRRAGTVAWRSGLSLQGACAHFIETEFRVRVSKVEDNVSKVQDSSTQDGHDSGADQRPAAVPVAAGSTRSAVDGPAAAGGRGGGGGELRAEGSGEDPDQWSLVDKSDIPTEMPSGTSVAPPAATPDQAGPAAAASQPLQPQLQLQPQSQSQPATVHSLVQLRGSLPLLWSSPPNLELQPRVLICDDNVKQEEALSAYLTELRSVYKAVSLLLVPQPRFTSLIETLAALYCTMKHKKGGRSSTKTPGSSAAVTPTAATATAAGNTDLADLAAKGAAIAESSAASGQFGQLLAVAGRSGSLHVVSGTSGDSNSNTTDTTTSAAQGYLESSLQSVLDVSCDVSKVLLDQPSVRRRLMEALRVVLQTDKHGWFTQVEGCNEVVTQQGVLSLSCPGPLDLTNLLQCELGLGWLERVLQREGLLSEGHTLERDLPALNTAVRTLWANQGGVLSDQMTAGGCRSSSRIRAQGQTLSVTSRVWDCLNLLHRYYGHNFTECDRQDVVDVMTGLLKVDPGIKAPARRPSQYTWLQLAAVCLGWAVLQLLMVVLSDERPTLATAAYYVGMPTAVAVALVGYVWLRRDSYTPKPLIAPQSVQTW